MTFNLFFSWLIPFRYLLDEVILASHSDALRRGGRVQLEIPSDPAVRPSRSDGVLNGKEDAAGQE